MYNILVVDDDKHTRMLLQAVLEHENYTVFTAENGEHALELNIGHSDDIYTFPYFCAFLLKRYLSLSDL